MGRKLDALLGRKFKVSKFKATVNLAVSRLSVLKNQRQSRLAVARSDIVQLLNLNHHEHALLRVDQVIKEQNMIDVFVMVDGYCHLLLQMINLIEQERECPAELREAASSLLYAAPRCGEFPELQEIRAILTARFGKEFAYSAIELRSNCGVSTRMIQKLSPRQSTLQDRRKVLEEIATENGIVLNLEDVSPVVQEKQDQTRYVEEEVQLGVAKSTEIERKSSAFGDEFDEVMSFTESRKGRKYRDVEDAAQAAFESAAYAAAAARAAVELSRSRSFGSDNPDSPNSRPRKVLDSTSDKSKLHKRYEKTHESESETEPENHLINEEKEGERSKPIVEEDTDGFGSGLDEYKPMEDTIVFDGSDDEVEDQHPGFPLTRNYNEGFHTKQRELGPENSEAEIGEGSTMQPLDLTKRPFSVRTKRVYGQ